MKGVVCIVKDCKFSKVQKNCDVKFFKIPSGAGNMDRRAKWMEWLNKVNGNNWRLRKISRVCALHFIGQKPVIMPFHPDYAPSRRSHDKYSAEHDKQILAKFEILKKKKIEAMRKRYEMNYTQCEPKAQRIKHIVDNEEIDAEEDAEIDFEQDLAKYFPQEIQKPVVQKIEECVNQERLVIKKEIGIQAWFNELPKPECSKLFLCHTISVGNINHSEIQVYIPNETGSLRIIRPQGMVDKCCGPEIIYVDKLIGTDENNFDYYSSYSDSCEE